MTGRRDTLDATQAIVLDAKALPLAGRLEMSLLLGDLVAAAARWAHAHISSHAAVRANNVSKRPPEPCGAC